MSTPRVVSRREPEPFTNVRAAVAPHDGDLVALGHQMLDRELGLEGRPHYADALLQALHTLRLSRERVVLDVVRPRNLIENLQSALVAGLLIQPANGSLVL